MLDKTQHTVVDSSQDQRGAKFESLAINKLEGSSDVSTSKKLFFLQSTGVQAKYLRVNLLNSSVTIEPGALYFKKGKLEMLSSAKGGVAKSLIRKVTAGETIFQSQITGTGEIYLEPTLGHHLIITIEPGDELIVDQSSFYCCSGHLEVGSKMQKNVSSALFGGEGLFQTSIKADEQGSGGVLVLNSSVPTSEIAMIELEDGETLSVDGNFAVARSASVKFSAKKSGGSLLRTAVSGELLLQTFEGPGIVFLAPTQPIYDEIINPSTISTPKS